MARIESDGISGYRPGERTRRGRDTRPGEKPEALFPSLFERTVQDVHTPVLPDAPPLESLDEAHEMLDRIHQLGDKLSREQTFSRLREYREAVRLFLGRVVASGVGMEEHTSGTNILNRKRFTLIRVIDERLDRLAAGMVQTQQSQLELLRKVEEIQGLLVDLFH